MKKWITKRSIIRKVDLEKSYEVETDVSDKTMEIALKQRNEKKTILFDRLFFQEISKNRTELSRLRQKIDSYYYNYQKIKSIFRRYFLYYKDLF